MRRLVVLALAGTLLTGAAAPSFAGDGNDQGKGHGKGHSKPKPQPPSTIPTSNGCVGNGRSVNALAYPVAGQTATALYTLPPVKPKGIVVFDHGYSHTMWSWQRHMMRVSQQLGVITVTPNYRGQVDDYSTPLPTSRGWQVQEGAADTNAVALLFDQKCLKGKGHNVLYSVSMGGNTAGLALAAKPKRSNGKPMWDEWVDVEGAVNVLETYTIARRLAPANAFAANAVADIEREAGGTFEQVPSRYRELTVVSRVDEIAASGVKGVVVLHGVADGLVSHDESRQLQLELRRRDVPVDFRTFVTKTADSESGTTIDGYVPVAHISPFAGHASEASETHDVGMAGFAALAELYRGYRIGCRDHVSDGATGQGDTVYDGCA